MRFRSDKELEQSAVVANCCMNRERELTGSNGYGVEIGFNPLDHLMERAESAGTAAWLDLCCGSGRALIEASQVLDDQKLGEQTKIVGVDLVGYFLPHDSSTLTLIEASLSDWQPDRQFDLVTCVHGLHYIGDKLGLISRIASWLTSDGTFVANLDVANFVVEGSRTSRVITSQLRGVGLAYDSRRKLLSRCGQADIQFPLEYLGSDDQAGPNYTGQPAVNSYYRRI